VASDPETALAQIKPYLDLGFNHLVFHGPGHDQSRFLESLAAEVVPGLRTLMQERFDA
jgi:coenzyme F420-dependent glucose-6-phosphate dehydrogenase